MNRPKGLCTSCQPGAACAWCMQRIGDRAVELAMAWEIEIKRELTNDRVLVQARKLVASLGPQFGKSIFSADELI